MGEIFAPQSPADARQVMRALDEYGNFVFKQVGFQELDFAAVFGGKTLSTTENEIGHGIKSWTIDEDDGKILPGHTIQITALADPTTCFMYATVLDKDVVSEPARITAFCHTISPNTGTFANWEIQIVEVNRETTVELPDADFALEDHHKVALVTTPFTAQRDVRLPPGTTLVAGSRLIIVDAITGLTDATALWVYDATGVDFFIGLGGGEFAEFIWTGTDWEMTASAGIYIGYGSSSFPLSVHQYSDDALLGPNIDLNRQSASPAAADGLAVINFLGNASASFDEIYARIYADIVDPTTGSLDGRLVLGTRVAGAITDALEVWRGIVVGQALGGDKGTGTVNAKGYFIDDVPFTGGPDATTAVKGIVELATAAETAAGTDAVRAVTPAGLGSLSGFYTPATASNTNLDAAPTSNGFEWIRIGDIVMFSGAWTVNPTAAAPTLTGFNMSLPIAVTGFANVNQAHGTVSGQGAVAESGGVESVAGAGNVRIEFMAYSAANHKIHVNGSYRVV